MSEYDNDEIEAIQAVVDGVSARQDGDVSASSVLG